MVLAHFLPCHAVCVSHTELLYRFSTLYFVFTSSRASAWIHVRLIHREAGTQAETRGAPQLSSFPLILFFFSSGLLVCSFLLSFPCLLFSSHLLYPLFLLLIAPLFFHFYFSSPLFSLFSYCFSSFLSSSSFLFYFSSSFFIISPLLLVFPLLFLFFVPIFSLLASSCLSLFSSSCLLLVSSFLCFYALLFLLSFLHFISSPTLALTLDVCHAIPCTACLPPPHPLSPLFPPSFTPFFFHVTSMQPVLLHNQSLSLFYFCHHGTTYWWNSWNGELM